MAKFSQFKIALRNFSKEPQTYEFLIDTELFKKIDGDADIQKGSVKVSLVVKKTAGAFEFSFDCQGTVYVPCDRCLDEMPIEINSQNKLYVKFGAEYAEESDEIVIIPEEEGEINVVWFIYEFITLSIPMKRVHPSGKCNKMMSSKLNKYKAGSTSTNDEEDEVEASEEETETNDPRWESLKDLNLED